MLKLPVEHATSAGGVVLKKTGENIEILICYNSKRKIWALPKGTPLPGETIIETAKREVKEETGLEVEIKDKIGSINYWFIQDRSRFNKTVHFFLMESKGGSLDEHDPEFDRVEWVPLQEAYKRMSYKNEIKIISQAVNSYTGNIYGPGN